jgi:hypothetical protein
MTAEDWVRAQPGVLSTCVTLCHIIHGWHDLWVLCQEPLCSTGVALWRYGVYEKPDLRLCELDRYRSTRNDPRYHTCFDAVADKQWLLSRQDDVPLERLLNTCVSEQAEAIVRNAIKVSRWSWQTREENLRMAAALEKEEAEEALRRG